MRNFLPFCVLALLMACNNDKKPGEQTDTTTNTTQTQTNGDPNTNPPAETTGAAKMTLNVDGKDLSLQPSALISKDEKKLQADLPWFAMVTSTGGPDEESFILNFIFDLKPGTYPVVGMGLNRGSGDNSQVFGGLMGGQPKITEYKVNLTEVRDLGSNNVGGHRWSLSGNFEGMTIPAMSIMLIDKEKNHPKEVVIKNGSFSNITFDDNWEELLEKAFDKTKNN